MTKGPTLYCWPEPSGPHAVGIASFDLTDRSRFTTRGPEPLPYRRIHVYAWYPATADGREPRPYFTTQEARVLPATLNRLYGMSDKALEHCTTLATCSLPDAPPIVADSGLPLLVFCHGFFSFALQNTALMEELASHGYVVLSVSHPFESGGTVFTDGTEALQREEDLEQVRGVMAMVEGKGELGATTLSERLQYAKDKIKHLRGTCLDSYLPDWIMDQLFAVDAVQAGRLPDEVSFISQISEVARIGYFGMSYGGAVATDLCDVDPRAVAGINIDGSLWNLQMMDRHSRTPFLLLHSDPAVQVERLVGDASFKCNPALFSELSPQTPLYSDLYYEALNEIGLRDDILRFAIPRITHIGMTDLPIIAAEDWRTVLGPGSVVGPRYIALQNRVCLDFFDTFVKGKNRGFPGTALAACPEIMVRETAGLRAEAQGCRAN